MTTFGKFVSQSKECHTENNYEPMSVSVTGDFEDSIEESIASDGVYEEIQKYSDADKEVYELEKAKDIADEMSNQDSFPSTESVLKLSTKVQNAMSRLDLLGVKITSQKLVAGIESTFSSTPYMTAKLVREGVWDAMGSAKDKVVKWFKEMWNKFRGWLSKNLGIFRTSAEKAKKIQETLGKMKNKKVKENIEISDQYLLVRTCKQGPEGYEYSLVNLLNAIGGIGNAIIGANNGKFGDKQPKDFKTDHRLYNDKKGKGGGGQPTDTRTPQGAQPTHTEETTQGATTELPVETTTAPTGQPEQPVNPTQTQTPDTTTSGNNTEVGSTVNTVTQNQNQNNTYINNPAIKKISQDLLNASQNNTQNAEAFKNILNRRIKENKPVTNADLNQAFGKGRYSANDTLSPEEAAKILQDLNFTDTQSNSPVYYNNLITALLDNIRTHYGIAISDASRESFLSFSTISHENTPTGDTQTQGTQTQPTQQPAPQPAQQQNSEFAGHNVQASEELDEIDNGIYEYFAMNQAALNTQYNISVNYNPVAGEDSNVTYESNEVIAFVPDHNLECVGVVLARQENDKRAKIERMKITVKDPSVKDSYNKPSVSDLENFIKACCRAVSKMSNYEGKVSAAVNDINKIADSIDKFDKNQNTGTQSSTVAAPNNDEDGEDKKKMGGSNPYTTDAYRKLGECVKLMAKTTSISKMLVLVAAEALSFIESEDDSVNN